MIQVVSSVVLLKSDGLLQTIERVSYVRVRVMVTERKASYTLG